MSKRIEQRRGGWFVIYDQASGESMSGPWKTERAAELAREGKWQEAHAAERKPC